MNYNRHGPVCAGNIACFTYDIYVKNVAMSTMFTDNKNGTIRLYEILFANGFLCNKCIKLNRFCYFIFLFFPHTIMLFYITI